MTQTFTIAIRREADMLTSSELTLIQKDEADEVTLTIDGKNYKVNKEELTLAVNGLR